MNVRSAAVGTARLTKMTVGLGALALVGSAALSGCSGSGTSGSSILPTVTGTASVSVTASVTTSDSPSDGVTTAYTVTPTPTVTTTVTPNPTPTTTVTVYPTAAPVTGGGGTAGLQDITLFGIGGAAILFGAGTLAYRRRMTRHR
jgi:hypothetical protein